MGASQSTIEKRLEGRPTVLIVGCGFAGHVVAKTLDSQFNVVVFDRRDFFPFNVAGLRAAQGDPSFPWQSLIVPMDKLLKFGHVVPAEVTKVSPAEVTFKDTEPVKFDYLVIATGSTYSAPSKVEGRTEAEVGATFERTTAAIKSASKILLVGGGPVGVEFAGELRHFHPDKEVTIVSSADLLPAYSPKMRSEAKSRLEAEGARVIVGERVILDEGALADHDKSTFAQGDFTLKTDKGTELQADLVFFCTGAVVNNSTFKDEFKLDDSGRLVVNEFLQAEGCENVFGVGDCAAAPGLKLGYYAGEQAQLAAANIIRHDKNKSLKAWKSPPVVGMIPIGPKNGVTQLPTGVMGRRVTQAVKGDLFVPKYWESFNYKFPKKFTIKDEQKTEEVVSRDRVESIAPVSSADVQHLAKVMKLSPAAAERLVSPLPPVAEAEV